MNIDWTFSFTIVIVGLCVVFAVLVLLVVSCFVMGKLFTKKNNVKTDKIVTINNTTNTDKVEKKAIVTDLDTIPTEDIAAISGAISYIMGGNNGFVIKNIKKIRKDRNPWGTVAIFDNTRSF